MPSRRALIIDRNHDFRDLARRVLSSLDIETEAVDAAKAGLERIASAADLAIVLLAVEQPKKRGFSAFTQIKNLDKKVPIAIVTSTVPMEDMLLHQKLRLHGDAYLDKRNLDEAQLLRAVNGLLGLGLQRDELASLAEEAARKKRRAKPSRPEPELEDELSSTLAALEGLDPERDRAGEDDELEIPLEATPTPADDHAEELETLREEIERLHAELDSARRAAGSSPFSPEYLELSEKAGRAGRDLARMRAEVERRTAEAETRIEAARALERKVAAAARALTDEQQARAGAESRARSLEQQLEAATSKARDLGARLEAATRALDEAGEEHAAALAAARRELEGRTSRAVAEAREAHEKALAERERQHIERIAETRNAHEKELAEVTTSAADERRRELARAAEECLSQLETAEKKRRSDVEELAARQRAELGKVEEKWQQELDAERSRHRAELDALDKRYGSRISQLEKDKRAADEAAHKQAVKAAEAFDQLLREKQETQKLRARLSEELEKLETRHAKELRLIEQEQARALEALAERLHGGEPKEPRRAKHRMREAEKDEPRDPQAFTDLLESVQTLDEADEASSDRSP